MCTIRNLVAEPRVQYQLSNFIASSAPAAHSRGWADVGAPSLSYLMTEQAHA